MSQSPKNDRFVNLPSSKTASINLNMPDFFPSRSCMEKFNKLRLTNITSEKKNNLFEVALLHLDTFARCCFFLNN